MNNTKEKVIQFLDKLGYSKNLVSKRSRIFCFSLHSDVAVNVEVEDSLQENIDFTAYQLIVKKYGSKIED